jgi:hypothetical protein
MLFSNRTAIVSLFVIVTAVVTISGSFTVFASAAKKDDIANNAATNPIVQPGKMVEVLITAGLIVASGAALILCSSLLSKLRKKEHDLEIWFEQID